MTTRRPELMDRAQIEQLIERAFGLFDAYPGDWMREDPDDPDQARNRNEATSAALEALRFAAVAIAWLRDPALGPSLDEVVEGFDGWDLHADSHADVLSLAITQITRAGAPPRVLRGFAENSHSAFRHAVAEGLDANSEEGRELLDVLSKDPNPEVRKAAGAKLATVQEVPWWRGKFSRDPVEGLSAREARKLKGTLQELAKLLDAHVRGHALGRVAKLLDKLPDAAAVDGAEHVMRMFDWHTDADQPVLPVLLGRPGGSAAFLRYLRDSSRESGSISWLEFHHTKLGATFRKLEAARQEELGQCLLDFALAAPHGEPYELHSPWITAATLSSEAWPPSMDLTPVLDALLEGAEGSESDSLRGYVLRAAAAVFKRDDTSLDAVTDRILTARVAGYPEPWSLYRATLDEAIGRMPPARVRVFAERCLTSEHADTITWALQNLLGPLHDASRDPTPAELAARFYETPRYRLAMQRDGTLATYVTPLLRRDLREGTLDFKGAAAVMARVDQLWGGGHPKGLIDGLLSESILSRRAPSEDEEKSHATEREKCADLLGPAELHGTITERERAQWRRIRDRAIEDGTVSWRPALELIPEGPISAEDRVVLDQAIARWRAGDLDDILAIAGAIARTPVSSDLAVLDKLVHDEEEYRDMLKTARQNARRGLGLPPIPPRATTPADASSRAASTDDDDWPDDQDDA